MGSYAQLESSGNFTRGNYVVGNAMEECQVQFGGNF